MAEIVTSTTVTATGLALFTNDNAQANIQAITKVYLDRCQELETAIWNVYESRLLANATNAQLDLLGALVGMPRNNITDDTAYRTMIRIKILANISDGTGRSLTQIVAAALITGVFVNTGPAKFQLTLNNLFATFPITVFAALIRLAKALGVGDDILYSFVAPAHGLAWDTVAGGYVPAGWDDVADSLAIGEWSAVA